MKHDSNIQDGALFVKMHGLGNDFVIVDARGAENPMTPVLARRLADRNRGVGFDQLMVLRDGFGGLVNVDFWNCDGSIANACGNGTRCVARLLLDETGASEIDLQTGRGILRAERGDTNMVRVNMGQPQQDWNEIPLAHPTDLDALPLEGNPGAIGMGNPHCVFIVDNAEAVNMRKVAPLVEHDPLFPERTNVEFIHIVDRQTIRMRVWERGGLITQACGSGACAAVVVAARRGLTDRTVTVRLDGGDLEIDWRDNGVWMTGPTSLVFEGRLSMDFLASVA